MSDENEQPSIAQQAKQWFLSLIGLDEESRAGRDAYVTHMAIERVIEDCPELVHQYLGIEGVDRDQTLDAATKEKAYAALASLAGYDVSFERESSEIGPPEVGAINQPVQTTSTPLPPM